MRALLAVIACFLIAAPADAAGSLRRGNLAEPTTLDPHKFNSIYENFLAVDLFEGLTTAAPDGKPMPAVAQSWSVSADGMTWTFKLRPGLRWSDGVPITVQDVIFSFRRILDPKTAGQLASSFYVLKNARQVNGGALPAEELGISSSSPDTVVIALEQPAPYLSALFTSGTAAIVPRHVVEKFGDDWVKAEHFVSNGAFTLKRWISHGGITFARNPNFHTPAVLDEVIYEPTDDMEAAVTRFRAGGLDMQFEFPSIRSESFRKEMPAATKIVPAQLTFELQLNNTVPKLKDARVRRALSLAIDRDLLVTRVTRGGEIASMTYVPPTIPDYTPPEAPMQALSIQDRLTKAKSLLAEAGYTAEKPLRLTYSFTNNTDRKRIAVAISAMWKQIGVDVALHGLEGKVLFSNLRAGDFEVGFMGSTADYPDAASFLTSLLSTEPGINYSRYNSAAYDALIARAGVAPDARVRADLLRQAEALMLEDQPLIPLYAGVNRELVSPRVHGWEPNPSAIHLSRYLSIDPIAPPRQ